jgi:hypothetical protein
MYVGCRVSSMLAGMFARAVTLQDVGGIGESMRLLSAAEVLRVGILLALMSITQGLSIGASICVDGGRVGSRGQGDNILLQ